MQTKIENAQPDNEAQLSQLADQQAKGGAPATASAENEAPQYSADETEAMRRGWKPKEQFEGEGWRSAREFLERGELLDKISSMSKELKDYKNSMQNVETLIKRREDLARKQVMEELTQARREAIQSGDVETVERIDEDLHQARQEMEAATKKNEIPGDVSEWMESQKSWFNADSAENKRMVKIATTIEADIHETNPGISHREALQKVEEEIKRLYPHRFESPGRKKPDVEAGTAPAVRKKQKYDPSQVSGNLKIIARDFVRKGVFKSEEEYYESYFGV